LQVNIAADTDWESTVTLDAVDFNTVSWQTLKDKSSPKSKRKLSGNIKKTFSGKESPKREIRTTQRDGQLDWRLRYEYLSILHRFNVCSQFSCLFTFLFCFIHYSLWFYINKIFFFSSRDVTSDKSAQKSSENWRSDHRKLIVDDNVNQKDVGENAPFP